MDSLPLSKVRALLSSLERIHSATNLKEFPTTVFDALKEVIEGSFFSLDTLNVETGEVISATSESSLLSDGIRNRIVELIPTHPAMPLVRAGATGAIRISECLSQRQFEQTALYRDVFVPLGIRHQTVVTLDIPGQVAGVTVNRDTGFTKVEAQLLSLAAPHVALAHRNLQTRENLKMAAAQVVPGPEQLERIGLTRREAEVLYWVIKGKQDEVIAGILRISVRTVHQYVTRILRKLRCETRGSAGYEAMLKVKSMQGFLC